MDNTKSILYLVPYEYYLLGPSAPFWPFILPIVNFVVAIVRTYFRAPAQVTLKLWYRFFLLHFFLNTGKILTHTYWFSISIVLPVFISRSFRNLRHYASALLTFTNNQ